MPSCLFDAVVVPDGEAAAAALSSLGHAVEFVKDQYRHCKPILALGAGRSLLEKASLPLDARDAAVILSPAAELGRGTKAFAGALQKHRNWDRAMDPPPV
jgi:catalase